MNNSNNQTNWKQCLKEYYDYGFSLIPVNGKRPLVEWTVFQKKRPEWIQIEEWLDTKNFTGWAVVTGKISGIVVLDIDLHKGATVQDIDLPDQSPFVKSGSGGLHFYFKYPKDLKIGSPIFRKYIEVRGDGGIIVLPPSIHPETNVQYKWINDLTYPLPEIPKWLTDSIENKRTINSSNIERIVKEGSQVGSRNIDATAFVGKLLHTFPEKEWESFVWPILQDWNENNDDPLNQQELNNIYSSISKAELEQRTNWLVGQNSYNNNQLTDELERELKNSINPIETILQLQAPENMWLIENLIPRGGITGIAGVPKVGKSFIVLDLVRCVASGEPFLKHFKTRQANVLIISKEDSIYLTKNRSELLQIDSKLPIYISTHSEWNAHPNILNLLLDQIENTNTQLIIFDSLIRILIGDENTSKDVTRVHKFFKHLTNKGLTVLFIHHVGKSHEQQSGVFQTRGSSDIPAMVDSLLMLKASKDDASLVKMEQVANRYGELMNSFQIKFPNFSSGQSRFQFIDDDNSIITDSSPLKSNSIADAIIVHLSQGSKSQHKQEIIDALVSDGIKASKSTFIGSFSNLQKQGKINVERIGNKHICTLINQTEVKSQVREPVTATSNAN